MATRFQCQTQRSVGTTLLCKRQNLRVKSFVLTATGASGTDKCCVECDKQQIKTRFFDFENCACGLCCVSYCIFFTDAYRKDKQNV